MALDYQNMTLTLKDHWYIYCKAIPIKWGDISLRLYDQFKEAL